MKLSKVAKEVIRLADATEAYWSRELPKRHPDYPLVHPGEDSGPPPPEEAKLRKLLASLPEESLYKLALILYLGRGDFDTSDLESHYESLKETLEDREIAIHRIMVSAGWLPDGLEELKKHNINVDTLLSKSANSHT